MKRYNPEVIETKWQKYWNDKKAYIVDDNDPRPKFYHLVEFPYPSGEGLHVGHTRPFVPFDVMSRFRRMNGENVLFPMGWDSFGLPAEQYALKTGVHPAKTTEANINTFRKQEKRLGLSFDWSREFSTADPKIYRWTQWIFVNLFSHGLAYQAESLVWWCEDLKSVLADEEVTNGRSERGDYPCERRPLRQWMLAITKYAQRLYDDLDDVDYIEPVKIQQRNWIGPSKGAEVVFKIVGSKKTITVFTTRVDTIFSAAFIVLAPENNLISEITTSEQKKAVEKYLDETSKKSDVERQEVDEQKTGVFSGAYTVNPANDEKIPIWISDFVLAGYGTGAVFGDIHDERDFEFVNKFKIPARVTVIPEDPKEAKRVKNKEYPYTSEGILIDSGKFSGMRSEEAREKITKWLSSSGDAREKVNFKLRDWVFSRQRYWGEPIPIVWVSESDYKKASGEVTKLLPKQAVTKPDGSKSLYALPILAEYLPVVLPEVPDFKPQGLGKGPLALATDWCEVWYNVETGETVSVAKPKSTSDKWVKGTRETDTMPNWAGSSWYFLRYLDPHNDKAFASMDKIKTWMPVNWYNGGLEHTTLHLLYSRFWHKFLFDLGLVNTSEPYHKRTSHGVVLASDGRKMSKSLGNVVDPLDIIRDYGADTLRLYICFMGPFEQTVTWSVNGVAGCRRYIERFWALAQEVFEAEDKSDSKEPKTLKNKQLKKIIAEANLRISRDILKMSFNTAVAALMETINKLYKLKEELAISSAPGEWLAATAQLIQLNAPFMPHLAEELWEQFGFSGHVLKSTWPELDNDVLISATIKIAVQDGSKLVDVIEVDAKTSEEEVISSVKKSEKVKRHFKDKKIVKTIYVQGRLVNFVSKA
ncbi:MAG TPA: leucine--tRNA ligase [Candidatus Saccharimonadales bacterium]|nr:leucine--tRNA ligase [Candidatus Saccharimonadales bacterium]